MIAIDACCSFASFVNVLLIMVNMSVSYPFVYQGVQPKSFVNVLLIMVNMSVSYPFVYQGVQPEWLGLTTDNNDENFTDLAGECTVQYFRLGDNFTK
jgi:hypothetical protein